MKAKQVGVMACLAGVLALGGWAATRAPGHTDSSSTLRAKDPLVKTSDARVSPHVDEGFGKLPLSFEPNLGQSDPQVQFLARGRGYSLFLGGDSATLVLQKGTKAKREGTALRMRLLDARANATALGVSPLPGKINYYRGNDPKKWHEGVPTFAKVSYPAVYPGVDLVYYGHQGQLEYDFIVAPEADPSRIRLAFDGPAPRLEGHGDLVFAAGAGEVRLHRPVVYQDRDGQREPVDGRFVLAGDREATFVVGRYDRGRPLVIDPVLVYATYLGGAASDQVNALAVDSQGSAIVVGKAESTDFPTTAGAYQATNPYAVPDRGAGTVFITKFSPDGKSLVFSTFLGGSQPVPQAFAGDTANAVAVGPADSVYVVGLNNSTDFPNVPGALQPSRLSGSNGDDAFAAALSASGTLIYATPLGGDEDDVANGVAVDAAGNAYVTGDTSSWAADGPCRAGCTGSNPPPTNFPTTATAYEPGPIHVPQGSPEPEVGSIALMPFVTEINPTGTKILYSTLLGPTACKSFCSDGSACDAQGLCAAAGGCLDYCFPPTVSTAIALGGNGIAYIAGETAAPTFPVTPGAFKTTPPPRLNPASVVNTGTGFVAAFDTSKTGAASLVYSTYFGGSGLDDDNDDLNGLTADADGNVYITGSAESPDFPTTAGAYQRTCPALMSVSNCSNQVYVAKLDPTGSKLVYSTFVQSMGGQSAFGMAIKLDAARNAYVLGVTNDALFPQVNPLQPQTGYTDIFVTTVNPDGSQLLFSTYLGGTADDGPSNNYGGNFFGNQMGLALDPSGNIYVGTITNSTDFPVTTGAVEATLHNSYDGVVAKISPVTTGGAAADGGTGSTSDAGSAGSPDGAVASGGDSGAPGTTTPGGGNDGGPGSTPGSSSGSSGGCAVASGQAGGRTSAAALALGLLAFVRRRRANQLNRPSQDHRP